MKYFIRSRILLSFVICLFLFSQLVFAEPAENVADDVMGVPVERVIETKTIVNPAEEGKVTVGVVSTDILNVRSNPGTDQQLVGKLNINTKVKIVKSENGWHNITAEGVTGWVHGEYISNISTVTEDQYKEQISRGFVDRSNPPAPSGAKAESVVALAKQQLGKRYAYGTAGPNTFDCSGFINYIYRQHGISTPRSTSGFTSFGVTVSKANLQPGDVILFDTSGPINGVVSHVGLYVGNRQIIHASTGGRGVVYDSIDAPYYAARYIKAVRVL